MRKILKNYVFVICVLTLFSVNSAAQSGKDKDVFMRFCVGLNSSSPSSDHPALKTLWTPMQARFPYLGMEYDPLVFVGRSINIHQTVGLGFVPFGFRNEMTPDSIYYFSRLAMLIYTGIGGTYNDLEIGSGRFPVTFLIGGFAGLGIVDTEYFNKEKIGTIRTSANQSKLLLGLSSRLFLRLVENDYWHFSLFYGLNLGLSEISHNKAPAPYKITTNSFGIAISIASDSYVTGGR